MHATGSEATDETDDADTVAVGDNVGDTAALGDNNRHLDLLLQ